jgi:hypothetical protein
MKPILLSVFLFLPRSRLLGDLQHETDLQICIPDRAAFPRSARAI